MSTDDRFQQAARAVSAGLLRYGAGDLRGAAEELRRALQLAPDYPRAQRYLGWVQRCLREQGPGRPPAPPLVAPLSAAPEQISSASALTPPLSHERKTGLKQVEDAGEPVIEVADMDGEELDMADLIAAAQEWEDRPRRTPTAASSVPRIAPPVPARPVPAPLAAQRSAPPDAMPELSLSFAVDEALAALPEEEQEFVDSNSDLSNILSNVPLAQTQGQSGKAAEPEPPRVIVAELPDEHLSSGLSHVLSDVPLQAEEPASPPSVPATATKRSVPPPAGPRSGLSDLFSDVPLRDGPAGSVRPGSSGSSARLGRSSGISDLFAAGPPAVAAPTPLPAAVPPSPPAAAGRASNSRLSDLLLDLPLSLEDESATDVQPLSPLTPVPQDLLGEAADLGDKGPPEPAEEVPVPFPGKLSFASLPVVEEVPLSLDSDSGFDAPQEVRAARSAPRSMVELKALGLPEPAEHDKEALLLPDLDVDVDMDVEADPDPGLSMASPLSPDDLFADLQVEPVSSPRGRPLVARQSAGETPDFVVEFEEASSSAGGPAVAPNTAVSPRPPESRQPPPRTSRPPPPPSSSPRVAPPPASLLPDLERLLSEALDALRRQDLDQAYDLAERLIEQAGGPLESAALRPYLDRLAQVYEGLLQPMERFARAGNFPAQLEPRTAFLLSLLDGSTTIEEALTISGMDRLRGARTMAALLRQGLIYVQ